MNAQVNIFAFDWFRDDIEIGPGQAITVYVDRDYGFELCDLLHKELGTNGKVDMHEATSVGMIRPSLFKDWNVGQVVWGGGT